jgi:hypothetical protein
MTEPVNDQNLVEQLRATFPELEKSYTDRVENARGELPSNYEVVGLVLKPQLRKELEAGSISDFVQRCAAFMERVCLSGNVEAINVIWIKIFEWLIHEPKFLKILWPILGQATKAGIEDAAARWGKITSLPISGLLGALRSSLRRQ